MTHYQILGIPQDSSTADIKSAFITLSKSHHPDLNSNDPSKHDVYVRIMQAYTVLSKPELRSTYDSRLHAAQVRHQHSSAGSSSTFDFDPSSSPSDWTVESNAPRFVLDMYNIIIIIIRLVMSVTVNCTLHCTLKRFTDGETKPFGKCGIGATTSFMKRDHIMESKE